eukprot:5822704-Alexandrium_andersonii.AAC.1
MLRCRGWLALLWPRADPGVTPVAAVGVEHRHDSVTAFRVAQMRCCQSGCCMACSGVMRCVSNAGGVGAPKAAGVDGLLWRTCA